MRRKTVHRARRGLLLIIGLAIIASVWSAEQVARAGYGPAWLQFLFAATGPTGGLRVGLVAGHRGNDSGTVCPDGLTEVEVNTRIAELTADRLRSQGMRVDVLDELDARLFFYRADAFVSIHTDSCQANLSGFKVAPPDGGSAASRRLAECLWDEYEDIGRIREEQQPEEQAGHDQGPHETAPPFVQVMREQGAQHGQPGQEQVPYQASTNSAARAHRAQSTACRTPQSQRAAGQ